MRKAKVDLSQVDFCIDGLEAFNHVINNCRKGEMYDIILTDFNMPVLDGISSTRKIRMFLTENEKIDRIDQPLIYGITAHFHKNFIV